MKSNKIFDVQITDLNIYSDEKGSVLHMLRSDSSIFADFGEIYFSKIYYKSIKAWKQHQEMTMNIAVPVGKIKLVLYDDRDYSESQGQIDEFDLSDDNYKLVTIPPLIWVGFQGIEKKPSMLANLASIPHSPREVKRLDTFDKRIPYKWHFPNY